MAEETTQAITFKAQDSGKTTSAHMRVRSYSDKEQNMRALKALLKFWGIALVCVLIPVAHFLLVPLFFIMGVVKAAKLRHQAQDGLDAQGQCPACEENITLPLDGHAELPQWLDCPQCGKALELRA